LQLSPPQTAILFLVLSLFAAVANGDDIQSPTSEKVTTDGEVAPKLSLAVLSGRTLFGSAKATLSTEGIKALQNLITDLHSYQSIVSIRVVGHTDSVGDDEFNMALSLQRAEAVASLITQNLINTMPEVRISTLAAGERYPVATNTSKSGRARNRRVEIQVLATAKSTD